MPVSDRRRDYRVPLGCGMLLFLLATVWDVEAEMLRYLLVVIGVGGLALMGWGMHIRYREERVADERFLVNRLKASRIALIAGLVAMGGLMAYDWILHQTVPIELAAVVVLMALAKVVAMLYFHRT